MKRRSFLGASALAFLTPPTLGDLLKTPEPDQSEVLSVLDLFRVIDPSRPDLHPEVISDPACRKSWMISVPDNPEDSFIIPYYTCLNSITIKPEHTSRKDVISRIKSLLKDTIDKKITDDIFKLLIAAAIDRPSNRDEGQIIFGSPELKERLLNDKSEKKMVEYDEFGDQSTGMTFDYQSFYENLVRSKQPEIALSVKFDKKNFIIGQPSWGKFKIERKSETEFVASQTISIVVLNSRSVKIVKAKDV